MLIAMVKISKGDKKLIVTSEDDKLLITIVDKNDTHTITLEGVEIYLFLDSVFNMHQKFLKVYYDIVVGKRVAKRENPSYII